MSYVKADNKLMNLIIEVCNYTTMKQNKKIGIITLRMGSMERLSYCFKISGIIHVLSTYKKGTYNSGIKVSNSFPSHIKNLSDDTKQLKSALKSFLRANSFYLMNTLI